MKVYNTLTRKKEEFIPLNPDEYRIYVCGPTVYNYIHIGNARPFVVFDTLRKYLEYRGNRVRFIQNFTDVDDKIINRAREEGVSPFDIGQTYIDAYFEDVRALNVEPATVHPRVTETIPEIIDFVSGLVDNGLAYEVNGDVYYSARKFTDYGKLSKQNIEELEAGSRVGVDERKHDPLDFVLWKAQKEGEEMAWDSPWGPGRPGWHIECSAMAKKYLGETIDLHAGGQDLQFPHHENEIAQSEGYTGKPFARYWMHNGYITVDDEKMSKSLGNFFTVRDILKEYEGEVLRYFLLSGHYRGPSFSRDLMEQSKNSLERMQNAKANLLHLAATGWAADGKRQRALEGYAKYRQKFIDAMDDDRADAISAVFELIRDINTDAKQGASRAFAEQAWQMLDELTAVLGLLRTEAENGVDQDIQALIDERQQARARKDFARADAIRDELAARGITLKDTPQGVQILRN